jgi:hypothetical protein
MAGFAWGTKMETSVLNGFAPSITDASATLGLFRALFNNDALLQEFGDQVGNGGCREASQVSQADARNMLMPQQHEQRSSEVV